MVILLGDLAVFYSELFSTMGSCGNSPILPCTADGFHAMRARVNNFLTCMLGFYAAYWPNVRGWR